MREAGKESGCCHCCVCFLLLLVFVFVVGFVVCMCGAQQKNRARNFLARNFRELNFGVCVWGLFGLK